MGHQTYPFSCDVGTIYDRFFLQAFLSKSIPPPLLQHRVAVKKKKSPVRRGIYNSVFSIIFVHILERLKIKDIKRLENKTVFFWASFLTTQALKRRLNSYPECLTNNSSPFWPSKTQRQKFIVNV